MKKKKLGAVVLLAAMIAAVSTAAHAQAKERGVLVREAVVYLTPDAKSAKMGQAGRGREIAVLARSREWVQGFVTVGPGKDITGWILDKGVVGAATPNGDRILFGEAADSEAEASRRRGRKGAAEDAMRLYYRTAEYFPSSPLAGEALYRAAEIRWQIDTADLKSRPSSKDDPRYRPLIDEELVREVKKKFPNTKWAAMAEFLKLENKLCGDWQGQSKCPEKETGIYEEYVKEHPQSPKAAEALYLAAWRQAALIEIYKTENNSSRSATARTRGIALAQRVVSQHAESEWALRAARLAFGMEPQVALYGNTVE
jgi:outer membrane protein assembly factor BamD (BamD/ComL family)